MSHTKSDDKFVSPLAKARGLGSAHEGVHHWLQERITGALLVPLVFWLVYSILKMKGASYILFIEWVANPVNACLLIFFIAAGFFHAAAGLQVVIEDYVSSHCKKLLMIICVKIAFALMAIVALFSVLKIAL